MNKPKPKIQFLWLIEIDPVKEEMDYYQIKYASDEVSSAIHDNVPQNVRLTSFSRADTEELIKLQKKMKETHEALSKYIEEMP